MNKPLKLQKGDKVDKYGYVLDNRSDELIPEYNRHRLVLTRENK